MGAKPPIKNGRGDSRPTQQHAIGAVLQGLLGGTIHSFDWAQVLAVAASYGHQPTSALPNATAARLRREGYLTFTDVAKAAGVGRTTLHRWMAEGRLRRMPEIKGVMAIHRCDLATWVELCQRLRKANPGATDRY